MDAVFYFHFYEHNNDFTPLRSLAFYATNLSTTWEQLDETIAFCAEDMDAKYGEHCGVIGNSGVNAMGYASSEIEGVGRQDRLMDAWRNVFVQRIPGCVVGEVFDVTDVASDAEIFQHTKDAYEQQQAEQLRDKLNTHVTTTSVASCKKM